MDTYNNYIYISSCNLVSYVHARLLFETMMTSHANTEKVLDFH